MTDLTADFYRRVSASFSATRQAPWPGWQRVLDETGVAGARELSVLDLACGNLRFERYVQERVGRLRAWAADSCDALAQEPPAGVCYQHVDLVWHLGELRAPLCDLSVSFGFMHHLPLAEQRLALLNALVEHTCDGGFVAVSFWQFAKSERILSKATPVGAHGEGDYLLGWQDRDDVRRYCHSFSEDEVDQLALAMRPRAREVARFSADGRSGDLNRYVVLGVGTR